MVAGVDAATREHVRARHERHRMMPSYHEHFGAAQRVAQHDDSRRRTDRGIGRHAKTIARRPICYGKGMLADVFAEVR
jgi:hypothetical protein